jgi:PAS domain S-box-containing protein
MQIDSAFDDARLTSPGALQRLKRALDSNPLAAFIQDLGDRRFLYLSPRFESRLGVQIQDVLNGAVDIAALIHPDDLPLLNSAYMQLPALPDSETRVVEFRFKSAGLPDWRWLRTHYSVFERSPAGDVTLVLGFCEDITGQSRFYQAAHLASIGQLASSLAHQLYNPLSTVIAEAQLLERELVQNETARASSQAILEAGWRAQRVIEALLILSQSTRSVGLTLSVSKTVQDALSLMGSHFESPGIALSVDLAQDLEIVGSPQQITDLWLNLMLVPFLNCEDGKIKRFKIQARAVGEKVVTSFSNDGMRLTPGEAEHIFEPRIVPYGAERGHGLELLICQEIVRQHAGTLTARQEGEFVIFEVVFSRRGAL